MTTPPSSMGATLSPCRLPLDTASPSSETGYSASWQRLVQHRIGGDQRGHARGRGAAEAGAQRDAFLQFQLEAVCQPQSLAQGQQRLAGGVAFGRERKRRDTFDLATDRGDKIGRAHV